jgi:peptidoglycan hydrolase-like protein with peptidoglycan-binding domain
VGSRLLVGACALVALVLPSAACAGSVDVAALQVALRLRGAHHGAIDGILGPETRAAIRRFQRREGLAVDGVAGPRTIKALGAFARHRLGSRLISSGVRGWDAAGLQFMLVRCELPVGRIDGVFGPRTQAAVLRYQRHAGVAADGVVGAVTLASLRTARECRRLKGTIPRGVTVARIALAGLTARAAESALRSAFARPLTLRARGRRWLLDPARFARPHVYRAVRKALQGRRGEALALHVAAKRRSVRRYAALVERRIRRRPVDARLVGLRDLRPSIGRAWPGRRVRRSVLAHVLVRRLSGLERSVVRVPLKRVEPKVTRANFGPVVVIRRGSHNLFLYRSTRLTRVLSVGTGRPANPTPLGRFWVANKIRRPWWYPPAADWARGLNPIPPGPGNPLGTRWMGLNAHEIGIHATSDASSVGYSRSHGCIRMLPREAEWLFRRVRIRTPVVIVAA